MAGRTAGGAGGTPSWLLRWLDWHIGKVNGKGDGVSGSRDKNTKQLEKRLEAFGWGLLFLLFAALALPNGNAEYASAAAVGAAMLGLNLVRVPLGVAFGWFSMVVGDGDVGCRRRRARRGPYGRLRALLRPRRRRHDGRRADPPEAGGRSVGEARSISRSRLRPSGCRRGLQPPRPGLARTAMAGPRGAGSPA